MVGREHQDAVQWWTSPAVALLLLVICTPIDLNLLCPVFFSTYSNQRKVNDEADQIGLTLNASREMITIHE
jgi:hypothetical protein